MVSSIFKERNAFLLNGQEVRKPLMQLRRLTSQNTRIPKYVTLVT